MKWFYFIVLYILNVSVITLALKSPHGTDYFRSLSPKEFSQIPKEIVEDALLDVEGLILKYGYPAEVHEVKTEDGYLLTLHRIPRGKNDTSERKRIPVLLMHGLLCSSADWIVIGPEKALGYLLADLGYDVWMGNARGNYYSRKHIELKPESRKFWRFSWHEIAVYDLTAMIDYILHTNGAKKLHYVGHSQGTTTFFTMCSERPEYNDKILSMQALAPVTYTAHAKTPILKYLAKYAHSINILLSLIGVNEVLPKTELLTSNVGNICNDSSPLLPLCTNILFILCGYNPDQLNTTLLPVILSHTPAGASSRQLVHYSQIYVSDIYRNYDYGFILNINKYGSIAPPKYKLKKASAPVVLYYSENDWLADIKDVYRLRDELPNVVGSYNVPDKLFNHLDYLWAIDVKTLLYDSLIENMATFERSFLKKNIWNFFIRR